MFAPIRPSNILRFVMMRAPADLNRTPRQAGYQKLDEGRHWGRCLAQRFGLAEPVPIILNRFSGVVAGLVPAHPSLHSTPQAERLAHKAGLRGEADRGVRGAESCVGASLHELKEKAAVEGLGVDLEILSRTLTVVEHVVGAQPVERAGLQVDARSE